MSRDTLEVVLKITAAGVCGVAAYLGVGAIMRSHNSRFRQQYNGDKFTGTGERLAKGLMIGQAALTGTLGILGSVASVVGSVKKVCDKNYYSQMINDPNMINNGNMLPPALDVGGIPYGQPTYRGKDGSGNDIIWRRSSGNVIEIY